MALGLLKALAVNVRAGFRMALFLRVGEGSLSVSPGRLLAMVWLAIFARLGSDILLVGFSGEWALDALPGLLFPIGLAVMVAAIAAELSGRPHDLALSLLALLGIGLTVEFLMGVSAFVLESTGVTAPASLFPWVAAGWIALASFKALARLLEINRRGRRAVLFLGLMGFLALPLAAIDWNDPLWGEFSNASDEPYDKKYDALTGEEAFYLQPRLLEKALAGLREQRPRQAELFFVGLAGDAEQGVFLKEVQAVGKLMGERFGTDGHAVTLANNYQAALAYPLASVTGLRQALRRVGETMDKEGDILFLFITSHGSQDHSILLDFWPVRFSPLNPQVLRQILDESRIKWRVVVVSACYSGGFIEPLRDDNTIVITAAAPDRTSFGCGDENDWTYFGKAFFDEALRHEDDLSAAFEQARRTIARREEEEQVEVESEPMIAMGSAMERKWRSFIEQRAMPGKR